MNMVVTTLKEFGTGQVTLPKEWREKFETRHYLARETKYGLLIEPILLPDDEDYPVELTEYPDGARLHFPQGIPASVLAKQLRQANEELSKVSKKTSKKTKGKARKSDRKNRIK